MQRSVWAVLDSADTGLHTVFANTAYLRAHHLQDIADLLFAHELGRLWFYPANVKTYGQLLLHSRLCLQPYKTLPPEFAAYALHLFLGIQVNQRLYSKLTEHNKKRLLKLLGHPSQPLPLWVLRLYEHLWQLPAQSLCHTAHSKPETKHRHALDIEVSAALGAALFLENTLNLRPENRLQRTQKQLTPFLEHARLHYKSMPPNSQQWVMVVNKPVGMQLHPEDLKAKTSDTESTDSEAATAKPPPKTAHAAHHLADFMSPSALRSLLPDYPPDTLLHQYYRELAWPHLLRLTPQQNLSAGESTPENFDLWHIDEPIQKLNWEASLLRSPTLIAGMTTLKSEPAVDTGQTQKGTPRLHLYLDCSRSMKNPEQELSVLVLSGFILMLSALRLKWNVRVINWAESTRSTPFSQDAFALGKALLTPPKGATRLPLEEWSSQISKANNDTADTHIILSDLGCLASLEMLTPLQQQHLNQWGQAHHVRFLLDLPLTPEQAERSFAKLTPQLSSWRFSQIATLQTLKNEMAWQ